MQEIWKDIVGYNGLYQVSNLGRIKSLNKTIKTQVTNSGYAIVHLYKNKKRTAHTVHRLVAIAFLLNSEYDLSMQVDHIDGDKINNSLLNLEFVTKSENMKRAFRLGLCNNTREKARKRLTEIAKKNSKENGLRLSGYSYSKIIVTNVVSKEVFEFSSFREASSQINCERKSMAKKANTGKIFKGLYLISWDKALA